MLENAKFKQNLMIAANKLGIRFCWKDNPCVLLDGKRLENLAPDEPAKIIPLQEDETFFNDLVELYLKNHKKADLHGNDVLIRKEVNQGDFVRLEKADLVLVEEGRLMTVYTQKQEVQNKYLNLLHNSPEKMTLAMFC